MALLERETQLAEVHRVLADAGSGLGGPPRSQFESGARRVGVFHGRVDSIRRHDRPLVVVLEDTPWADHATLDFVAFVARRIPHLPAVLRSTFRDDEVGADQRATTAGNTSFVKRSRCPG